MDSFQQLVLKDGIVIALITYLLWLFYKNRGGIWRFLYSEKWRMHLVRSVITWNDDLLKNKLFRKEMDNFLKLGFEDTVEIKGDMKRQLDAAMVAHQVAEQVLSLDDAIHRVLVLRMHNGDKSLEGKCLYKVSCIAERTERRFLPSAMTKLMQAVSIELLAYSISDLLDSEVEYAYLGVFKTDVLRGSSELNMLPDNQSYRLKCVDACGLFAVLVKDLHGKPLGILEAHLRCMPRDVNVLRELIARKSQELMTCL